MQTRETNIPKPETLDLRRELAMDVKAGMVNETERTVDLSFCSEAEYERWFGVEILDCSPGSIILGRLNNGGALLQNHDRSKQTGVVVKNSAKCENKRGVCTVKFSRSPIGETEMQDVKDGIRSLVSVGYIVHEMKLEKEVDGLQYFRVTKWEPYEVSIVSIPADPTVGVGREHDNKPKTTEQKISMLRSLYPNVLLDAKPTDGGGGTGILDPQAKNQERDNAIKTERERQKNIRAVATRINTPEVSAYAEKAIEDGVSVDEFNREILTKHFNAKPVELNNPDVGLSEKEKKRFSLCKAIYDIGMTGQLRGLEKEACEEAAKKVGRSDLRGFVLPEEINREAWEKNMVRAIQQRAQNATTLTAGGALVQTQYGPLIEFLRNKTVLGQLGITIMDGIVGNLLFPVQTGGATTYWVSETGALTDSQATFAQKAMTPHRLGCTIPFTTQLLAQSSISVEDFLRNEMAIVCALKKDLAGLEGSGVSGEPLGLKNTSGINATVTFGGTAVWADIVQFETGITVDNADIGTMGFALSAATVGKWKTILKDSVAGAGYLLEGGGENMTANGYSVKRTNQITGDIAFFGVWSQLIHAVWAGVEYIVDPYALKKSGQIEVTRNELCDFLVRQPLAFNVSTDSAAQ